MTFQATCPACNKRFRVPHDHKQWHCKVCDALLELSPLEDSASESAPTTKAEARRAKAALHGAFKPLESLRSYLIFVLILHALSLLLALGSLALARDIDLAQEAGTLGGLVVEIALLAIVLRQLYRQPLPAALLLAILGTVGFLLELLTSAGAAFGGTPQQIVALLFVLFYWYVVRRAAVFTRLARERPEFALAKKMHAEGERSEGSAARARRERLGIVKVVGGLFALILLVGAGLYAKRYHDLVQRRSSSALPDPKTPPDEVIDAFFAAWNARDIEGLADAGAEGRHAKWVRSFEAIGTRYGWGEAWPKASESAYIVDGRRASVEFDTEAGVLPFNLRYTEAERWELSSISFQNVKGWKD